MPHGLSETIYTHESSGKWAYIEDEHKLVFIQYSYEEIFGEEVYTETAEPVDGFFYYGFGGVDGEIKLDNDKLIVTSFEAKTVSFIQRISANFYGII